MTQSLKIECLVTDLTLEGEVASFLVTKEQLTAGLSKKADLVDGKIKESNLPDFIANGFQTVNQKLSTLETSINDGIQSAKDYAEAYTDEKLVQKADLVDGKVPASQLPSVEQYEGLNEALNGVLDQARRDMIERTDEIQRTKADLGEDGKVVREQLPNYDKIPGLETVVTDLYDSKANVDDVETSFKESQDQLDAHSLLLQSLGSILPYNPSNTYEEGYVTLKDGILQQLVSGGWVPFKINAINLVDASGESQQQVNYNGGSKWHYRDGGYQENERAVLDNGDIVKSAVDGNTNDPNVDATGWYNPDEFQRLLNFEQVSFTALGIIPNTSTDLTLKINQAFVTHRNLFIPDGQYVATAINIPSNTVITTQGNVTFKQKSGTATGTRLLNIVDADNVHLQPRINLIGNIATDEDEQNHGLFIRGAKHIRIGDVFGKDIRGDVVHVGGTTSQPVYDVEIGYVMGDNILRNVFSHTGGVNVRYAGVECLSGAGYATFDVEPNLNSQDCDDIWLGYFKGNRLLVAGLPSKPVGGVKVGFADFNKDYQTNTTPPYWAFDAIRYGALMIHNFTYVDIRHAKFENEDYVGIRITDSAGYIRGKEVRIGTLEQKNCSLNDPNYKAYNYIGLVDSFVVESGNIELQSADRYGFIGSNNNAEISNLKINGKVGDGFINPVYRKVEVKSDWDVYVHAGINTKPVFENCKIEFTGSVGRLTNADTAFVRDSNIQTGTFLVPSASTCKLENSTVNGQYYLSGYDKAGYKTATRVGNIYYWIFNDSMYTKIGSAPATDTDGVKNTVGRGAKVTYDPPSIAAGASTTKTVTVAGAVVGDLAQAAFSQYHADIEIAATVSAAGTVTVKLKNTGGSSVDLASGTLTVKLI